ncbi:hypothetical protein BT93_D1178 [Corymbia citriodora subsp. variegata]|nr:hypothetical protein BT93_D1178 [Corymbia citriodora subsp. variegata]
MIVCCAGEEWEGARLGGVHVRARVGKQHAAHGDGVVSPPLSRTPPWRTRSSRPRTRRAGGSSTSRRGRTTREPPWTRWGSRPARRVRGGKAEDPSVEQVQGCRFHAPRV